MLHLFIPFLTGGHRETHASNDHHMDVNISAGRSPAASSAGPLMLWEGDDNLYRPQYYETRLSERLSPRAATSSGSGSDRHAQSMVSGLSYVPFMGLFP